MSSTLSVIVDRQRLSEEKARAMWERFSAYMDAHQGDFDGFARSAGFVSASVAVAGGVPTLTLSSSKAPAATKAGQGKKRGPRRRGGKKRQKPRG